MGKKSGMSKGKKGGGGKGRSISNVKKTNIKRNKLAKSGKMKPMGSKPKFVEGGTCRTHIYIFTYLGFFGNSFN